MTTLEPIQVFVFLSFLFPVTVAKNTWQDLDENSDSNITRISFTMALIT